MSKKSYTPRIGQGPAGVGNGHREGIPAKLGVREFMRKNWHYLPKPMRGTGTLTLRKVEAGGQTTFLCEDGFIS